jgi:hypothetical protein
VSEDTTPQSLCTQLPPLYEITERLLQWQMMDWLLVITYWLRQYHGIEALISCKEQHPAHEILKLLISLPSKPDDAELAQRLSHLDFLSWRIAHADNHAKRWNPFDMTLCQYLDSDPPIVWQWDNEYPAAEETETWLLKRLAEVRTSSRNP